MALLDETMFSDDGSMTARSNLRLIDHDERTTRLVEVFADVRCPFAHVGLSRFMQRRHDEGRDDVGVWVRAWPLEIVNNAPLDPVTVARGVAALRRSVAPELFAGFDIDTFAGTSLPALRLAAAAYEDGIDSGERVSLALRDAQFEHGRDISATEVLHDIARQCGVRTRPGTLDAIVADWRDGRDRRVVGSPHFYAHGSDWFCPALRVTHDEDHLDVTLDREGFNEFTRSCFLDSSQ